MESSSAATLERSRGARGAGSRTPSSPASSRSAPRPAALMVAYVLANGLADSQGDFFRRWLWQLTHNDVVASAAVARRLRWRCTCCWAWCGRSCTRASSNFGWAGPGWRRGMRLLAVAVALFAADPAARGRRQHARLGLFRWAARAGGQPGAAPDLRLHAGPVVRRLGGRAGGWPMTWPTTSRSSASRWSTPRISAPPAFWSGGVIGAAVGIDDGGRAAADPAECGLRRLGVALAVGGILAGGAVGGDRGSFAGLPQTPPEPADVAEGSTRSSTTSCRF